MSAPIIWKVTGRPVSAWYLQRATDERRAEADARAALRTPGQLWQRLAELDVERHGEPKPSTAREKIRRLRERAHPLAPRPARLILDELVEHRRPAMRAARAELDALARRSCVTCKGAGWEPEVQPEPGKADMVICPDCWGSGKYAGSLSESEERGSA